MAESQPTSERWLPVVGYENIYEVSDHGRIWSVKRKVKGGRGKPRTAGGRILRGGAAQSGHRTVSLAHPWHGHKMYLVHRLVLEAFVGPCPEGMEACHWDDNPANNRLDNLRWATRHENMLDRSRNGIDNNGTKNATHCQRGHAFDSENTIVYADRHRACRECKNTAERRRRAEWRKANPIVEQTHCKRGHELVEPNLRAGRLPQKGCKACHRGYAWASHNGQQHRLQEVTDEYYARIMA